MKKNIPEKAALVLGGGGSRGAYEIGVWQALRQLNFPIDMVFGTSIGAINGAMIVQDSYDSTLSLWKELDTATAFDLESETDFTNALELISKKGGTLTALKRILTSYMSEETIRSSPMDYGLVTVEFPSLKPLYLRKSQIPKGKMMDYICASASCFPAIQAYEIDGKKYVDGGYADNVPVAMAVAQGATKIIAVDLHAIGIDKKSDLTPHIQFIQIGSNWDLGNFMIFDRRNSARIIRLGYLDTLKAFDQYDGNYHTFVKGEFDKETLPNADYAAKVFQLSTEIIYDKAVLNGLLVKGLLPYRFLMDENDSTEKNMATFKKDLKNLDMDLLKDKISETITTVKASVHPIAIALSLAENIVQGKFPGKITGNPALSLLLKEELAAAEYIVKEGLL
ncbi:MAG: patatin-like phospholipase family protein [Anaerovorax sp.]